LQPSEDHVHDAFQIAQYVAIADAMNSVTFAFETVGATLVIGLSGRLAVLVAVDFDDEALAVRTKSKMYGPNGTWRLM
jgi:hypothetical protein